MQPQLIQSMHEQVRAIYRAITGEEITETGASAEATTESDDAITHRFAELQVIARAVPAVMERVPPFSFTPPVDIVATNDGVVVEIALPGIARDAITIEHLPGAIAISGIRSVRHASAGERFHAEIPRGPFHRTIPLPFAITNPRIELDNGVLRIHLPLADVIDREDSDLSSSMKSRKNQGEEGNDEDGDKRRAAP